MTVTRQELEDRAREMGCFPDPENHTNTELRDAIELEVVATAWLHHLEQLPSNPARQDAIHHLRLTLEGK